MISDKIKNMINASNSLEYGYYLNLKKIIPKIEQQEALIKDMLERLEMIHRVYAKDSALISACDKIIQQAKEIIKE